MAENFSKISKDPYGAWRLIRRLIAEQGMIHWRRYLAAFALMAIAASVTAFAAYILGDVINEAYVKRNFTGIVWLSLLIFVLFALRGFAGYGHAVILSRIGNAITAHNQKRMFAKLMRENIGFFSDHHSSEFLARMTTGAAAITQVLNLLITAIGRDLLSLIGLVAVMVIQDPYMAIFGGVIAPPAMILLRKMIRRVKSIAHSQFTGGTRILENVQEALQGIRTVKAFTLESSLQARVNANIEAVERDANTMARVSNRASPLMETLGGAAVTMALIYGGYRVVEMGATPGQFFSFMSAFLLAYEPAKRLARLNLDLNNAMVGAQKLLEIVDSDATEPDESGKPALNLSRGQVVFENVSFAYRAGEKVIDQMSFTAAAGQTTALVGPSGGGKSTILNLLLRFYEAESGRILIDGQDIAGVSRQSLRRQTADLCTALSGRCGTIRDNIACS